MTAPDMSIVDLDLGVFADFAPPSNEALRWACSSGGASDIIFGLWSEDERRFRPRAWDFDKVCRVVDACVGRGVRPHLMIWATRSDVVFPLALDWLARACEVAPGVDDLPAVGLRGGGDDQRTNFVQLSCRCSHHDFRG